jgi:hypothetical protein
MFAMHSFSHQAKNEKDWIAREGGGSVPEVVGVEPRRRDADGDDHRAALLLAIDGGSTVLVVFVGVLGGLLIKSGPLN